MDKIDIVYLWVDGSDKKWLSQKEKWLAQQTNEQTTLHFLYLMYEETISCIIYTNSKRNLEEP